MFKEMIDVVCHGWYTPLTPSTGEAERGSLRLFWFIQEVLGHPGLGSENVSKKISVLAFPLLNKHCIL